MTLTLRQILFLIMTLTMAANIAWASVAPFEVDRSGYLAIAAVALAVGIGCLFYTYIREDEKLSAMLFGTFFLIVFSAGFSMLNYLLLTVAGPRIDHQLAGIDRMAGVDWPALLRFAESYPLSNRVMHLAYMSLLPQMAILVNCLGLCSRPNDVYKLCLTISLGAAMAVGFWTLMPSFGAFSLYSVPASSPDFVLAADAVYARELLDLLAFGPQHISPYEVKGLIAFPSFHVALAIFAAWYAWDIKFLRYPALALNFLVVLATPIQGGHHLIDLAGGLVVAVLAIVLTNRIADWSAKPAPAVRLIPAGDEPLGTHARARHLADTAA